MEYNKTQLATQRNATQHNAMQYNSLFINTWRQGDESGSFKIRTCIATPITIVYKKVID